MDKVRLVIVEDEPFVRDALVDLIGRDGSLEIVGVAPGPMEAVEVVRLRQPDVVLMDVKMGRGGGVWATRRIRACSPRTQVVAYSSYRNGHLVLRMLRAGATSYLVKPTAIRDIVRAIRRSARGESTLSEDVAAVVVTKLAGFLQRAEEACAQPAERAQDPPGEGSG